MRNAFIEYEVSRQHRDLEGIDRQLERWGWFRRGESLPPASGWKVRLGRTLVRLGRRLEGKGEEREVAVPQP